MRALGILCFLVLAAGSAWWGFTQRPMAARPPSQAEPGLLAGPRSVPSEPLGAPNAVQVKASSRPPSTPVPSAPLAPAPTDPASATEACPLSLRLAGTVHNARRPARSLAILRDTRSKVSGTFRKGARIDGWQLIKIEPRAVLLKTVEGASATCWLRITHAPSTAATRPRPRPTAKRPQRR